MLFSRSKTIITLYPDKLKAAKISIKAGKPIIQAKTEKKFTPENLADVFNQIKQELKTNSARILLPEDKTYLKLLELAKDTSITRDLVLEKAQEVIPEILEEGYFDWKQVEADKNLKIQFLAVSKDYLTSIQQAAQRAKLALEAFEPPSFALARLTIKETEPHLIIYKNTQIIVCAADKGQVFGVVTASGKSQIEKKTKELVNFVEEKWEMEIKKTVGENLDPVVGLALKEDIKGKDEKVLNLAPPKVAVRVKEEEKVEKPAPPSEEQSLAKLAKPQPEAEQPVTEKKPAKEPTSASAHPSKISTIRNKLANKQFVLIGLIIIAILGLIAGGIFIYKRAAGREKAAPVTPVVSSPPTPLETPEASPVAEFKREDLKLQVLNGCGIAGAAGKAKEFLEGLGYKDIEVGNAESYDHEETKIAIKENKKDYLELLSNDLSEKHILSVQTPNLDRESKFDVIVIIGER